MIKNHKLRQTMFRQLESTDDWLIDIEYVVECDIPETQLVDSIVSYFLVPMDVLSFPAKSYSVAIIYATLLKLHFNEPFFDSLSDPDLLLGDLYYVPYTINKPIYDAVLTTLHRKFGNKTILSSLPQIATTINYFEKEFYILPNPYFNNNNLS